MANVLLAPDKFKGTLTAARDAAVSVPLNLSGASSTFATVRLRCGAC